MEQKVKMEQNSHFLIRHYITPDAVMEGETSLQEQAQRVRDSLNGYELEITFGDESDLHTSARRCKKNPGHLSFTPCHDFNLSHLPEGWRSVNLLRAILCLAHITVRLRVKGVSADRPRGAFLYDLRGNQKVEHTATGWVARVLRMDEEEGDKPCPCELCKTSPDGAHSVWYSVGVITAKHVVHDDTEAQNTTAVWVVTLKPYAFYPLNQTRNHDSAELVCATHDQTIDAMRHAFEMESLELQRPQTAVGHLAVIVSYPHGQGKQITTGFLLGMEEVPIDTPCLVAQVYTYDTPCLVAQVYTYDTPCLVAQVYTYDTPCLVAQVYTYTPTCPGSSGAPVWVVYEQEERNNNIYSFPPHSGHDRKANVNRSGPFHQLPPMPPEDSKTLSGESADPGFSEGQSASDASVSGGVVQKPETPAFPARFQAFLNSIKEEIHLARRHRSIRNGVSRSSLQDADVSELEQIENEVTLKYKKTERLREDMVHELGSLEDLPWLLDLQEFKRFQSASQKLIIALFEELHKMAPAARLTVHLEGGQSTL